MPGAPPVRPGRTITGMSAILLPHHDDGSVDFDGLAAHVARTAEAGLTPAVNMDTGFVQLLDAVTKCRVLDVAAAHCDDFVAGAHLDDRPGDPFDLDGYRREVERIEAAGGTPIVFPTHGLISRDGDGWVGAHASIAEQCDRFLAFELGPMFVPYGRIYDLDAYRGLLEVGACVGAKHSSLDRGLEWERLAVRDEVRPDFLVLTGNDLAIDMVMYGSDYLLGLSTFAPDAFAERDRRWATGDPTFHELNDLLQYLGFFTFRDPVPGYRHDAALFLELRGWIGSSRIPDGAPRRPGSDMEILGDIARRLEATL
ncbi:MAG: dihydrodipicolinate synthase family protein [Acidimicrobiales bacterium]|nr:dihydrodipicolinate synthase family protein [Acidimicrobiales bacterium]MDP6911436.1 dihydrodipicolinate synthase family protein [Acidimicrobiales bacterium]HJP23852.1 dihydrodipicolinate synthase family protein [Acidimicrobiales bacterium]